jgi:hypothetical protein
MNIERYQVWEKKSFPFPTIVRIVEVTEAKGPYCTQTAGWGTDLTLSRDLFLGQGFEVMGDA